MVIDLFGKKMKNKKLEDLQTDSGFVLAQAILDWTVARNKDRWSSLKYSKRLWRIIEKAYELGKKEVSAHERKK